VLVKVAAFADPDRHAVASRKGIEKVAAVTKAGIFRIVASLNSTAKITNNLASYARTADKK